MQLRSAPAEEVQWWPAADHSESRCSSLVSCKTKALISRFHDINVHMTLQLPELYTQVVKVRTLKGVIDCVT